MMLDNRRKLGIIRQSATTLFLIAIVTSLFVAMGTTALMLRPADATPLVDAQGDTTNGDANFDLRNYGFDNDGRPYLQVYGLAGKTLAPTNADIIYAYALKTPTGFWVIDSHRFEHDPYEDNEHTNWHGQFAVDNDNDGCFDVESTESMPKISGKRITIFDSTATEVQGAFTLQLELVKAPSETNPYEPEEDCNAKIIGDYFDAAVLGTVTK